MSNKEFRMSKEREEWQGARSRLRNSIFSIRYSIFFFLSIATAFALLPGLPAAPPPLPAPPNTGFEFLHTGFENASPLHWEIDPDGAIQVYLVYDHERSSPNRANGHWHFKLQAKPGSKLRVVITNLDN